MSLNLRTMVSCCGVFAAVGIVACRGHVVSGENPGPESGGANATGGAGGTGGTGISGGNGGDPGGVGGSGGGAGGSASGGASGSSSGGASGSASGAGGSSGSTDGGPCYQACGTPAGAVQTFSTPEDVYAALVGVWVICPGLAAASKVFAQAPADTIGIEYTTPGEKGGNVYYLVQGFSGPVRGAGFDYQLTYDVSQSGSLLQLNMHPTPNSGFAPSFRFSPCPTQWQMGAMYGPDKAILIPHY